MRIEQQRSIASTLAIVSAVASFLATFSGHPFWGVFLAVIGVLGGLAGMLAATSPRLRGGILSLAAVIVGVIGLGVAVLGIIGVIIF